MCGILFIKKLKDIINKKQANDALSLLESRGPDSWDAICPQPNIYLGHKRLSIIDLDKRSNQPFLSSDKEHSIIFNGEIYNYKELKKQFNIQTRTSSDTEVLLELYKQKGKDCLQYLNGMFAFIIYYHKTGEIFVARDRLGIKPLYYYQDSEHLIFSSEIAPIIELTKDDQPDIWGIRQYLKMRATFRGDTIYKNIKVFPPAHYAENDKVYPYWELQKTRDSWHDDDIQDLLQKSINYRLIADVPVGSYLSGGLDSSIITALAKVDNSYTVGFKDNNEFLWSELVANHINTKHQAVLVRDGEYEDVMEKMIKKRRAPLSVPNEVLIYLMTKEVKKKNTVVLSGEGADELFFGYDRIFKWASNQSSWDLKGFDQHYSYGKHEDNEVLEYVLEPYKHIQNPIDKVAKFFQIDHLSGLLTRLDYCTMLCSVEARVPFVDHNLVEYMYGCPASYRMKDDIVKAPLKRIYSDIIPKENIERPKVGFPVPLAQIYKKETHEQGMESWLDKNMSFVFQNWDEIKSEILCKHS